MSSELCPIVVGNINRKRSQISSIKGGNSALHVCGGASAIRCIVALVMLSPARMGGGQLGCIICVARRLQIVELKRLCANRTRLMNKIESVLDC